EIKALEESSPLFSDKGEPPPTARVIPGTWHWKYHPNQTQGTFLIHPNGLVEGEGRMKPAGGSFLTGHPVRPERRTFAGGRIFVEHFLSPAHMERNEVDQIGVGDL